MATMNVSLDDDPKEYANGEALTRRGFSTASEYVRHLIRVDRERERLRDLISAGLSSGPPSPVDEDYFVGRRERIASDS